MFKPLELFVGLRYIRAKRRNQFISFISFSSMLGIALGVTALITVLSVMNGFVTELRERILGMASHITVSGYEGELKEWRSLADEIVKSQPRVVGLAPYIRMEGMLTYGQEVKGIIIRGILPSEEPQVSNVWEKMLNGRLSDLQPGKYNIILGKGLARSLGVITGDKVTLVTPQAMTTPAGILPRLKRFTVVGVFEVGHNDYDTAMAFIHIDDAAKLFRMDDSVTGVRLKLDDLFDAPKVRQELSQSLSGLYWLSDWTLQHANFFRAVNIEKRMMFFILMLIVAVAAFNIMASLVMVVTDKQADIAILRTLGTKPGSIMVIFLIQGAIIGVIGNVLGAIGGVSLALNVEVVVPFIERLFGVDFMPAEVYYISDFPSELHWDDVLQIVSVAFLLSILFTIYPAWRGARTQPAEALRYE
ncbi:MAG: lipoprotein-releasing ABC transporter permease subunit [Gammaproteobacteria bacterium]|nr:lipoprotein-releasing ABC transporter permease subunit [Gammaproteobacteria bacterium]